MGTCWYNENGFRSTAFHAVEFHKLEACATQRPRNIELSHEKARRLDALRYVILRHEDIAEPHFDLMFETSPGGALATWRSDVWPIERPTPVLRLADHRQDYLTYEGPISNDRGSVRRVESGELMHGECRDGTQVMVLAAKDTTRTIALRKDIRLGDADWSAWDPRSRRK